MLEELVGKINQLTIIEKIIEKGKPIHYKCLCDCGQYTKVRIDKLRNKTVKSCGCLRKKIAQERQWKGYGDISMSLWSHIKHSAKVREIHFDITIEQIWNLFLKQNKKCKISNIELVLPIEYKDRVNGNFTASLDRIDSSIGYVINNIQWIHKDINRMKNDFSEEYFLNLCKIIVENNNITSNYKLNEMERK